MPRMRRKKLERDEKFILDVLVVLVFFLLGIRYLPGGWLISLEWLTGNQVARLGFGVLALVFAIFDLKRKRPIMGAVALVPVIIVLVEFFIYVPLGKHTAPPLGADKVRVLTLNNATNRMEGLLEEIASTDADIACLQEIQVTRHEAFLDSALALGYHGWFVLMRDDAGMGTVILSREPLTRIDTLFTSSWNEKVRRFTRVTTSAKGRPLRVISMQLESTNRKKDLWGVIESWKLRMEQADRVRSAVIGGSTPIILAGDLNSTPTNRAIRPLLQEFTDSWKVAGAGFGGTWHRHFPLFRIDYILYDKLDGAVDPKFKRIGKSDHIAYYVDLILQPVQQQTKPDEE